MTELGCYERPLFFISEFYFGLSDLKLLLYDRYQFSVRDGRFSNLGIALDDFLRQNDIVEYCKFKIDTFADLKQILIKCINSQKALIVTVPGSLQNHYTSLVIDGYDDLSASVTSLQADDFYIRKLIPYDLFFNKFVIGDREIESQLVKIDDQKISIIKKIRENILAVTSEAVADIQELAKEVQNKIDLYLEFHRTNVNTHLYLENPKVLLGKVYWPMINTLCPLFIFLRHMDSLDQFEHTSELIAAISKFDDLDYIITLKGIHAKRNPTDQNIDIFFSKLIAFRNLYLEVLVLSAEILPPPGTCKP